MDEHYSALDFRSRLVWNLRDIGHTMRRISEGKGSQKRILIILLESGGMTQKELTSRLGVQPGSASEVIGKLEAAGHIARVPSGTDRRTADICLTDSGKLLAQEALALRAERHRQMFSALSDAEAEALLRMLEKLNADWDQKFRSAGGDSHVEIH